MAILRTLTLSFCSLLLVAPNLAQETTYYVSATKGKGKKGTKEEPVRDLSVIAPNLKTGDTVMIAGGTYTGRADCGSDQIKVACKILGGWSDDFTTRDPWGAHRTILSGDNKTKNWNFNARLWFDCRGQRETGAIVVDGIIVDNGTRNYYSQDQGLKLLRKANPSTGNNASPESPGILVDMPKGGTALITNCIVMNTAPTGGKGAICAYGHENSKLVITNNLVINNTGSGVQCLSSWHPKDGKGIPQFVVSDNSILFSWKYDPYATHGGSALMMDTDLVMTATGNVFAFNDYFGVDNVKQSKGLTLTNNLFGPSLVGDYQEFSTVLSLAQMEEAAQLLSQASTGNIAGKVELQLDAGWSASFAARSVIDRNKAEAAVGAVDSWQNDLRSMLGLALQGTDVKADSDVWLHRLTIDDAVKAGSRRFHDGFGCRNPSTAEATPGK